MSTDAMGVAGGVVRARDRRRAGGPRWPSVEFVELDALTGTAADTRSLVAAMRMRGAGVIVAPRRRRHRAGGVGDERRRRPAAAVHRHQQRVPRDVGGDGRGHRGRAPGHRAGPRGTPPTAPRCCGSRRAGRGDRARRRLRLDRGPRRLEGTVAARHPARGLLRVRRTARHRAVQHRRAAAPHRSHRPRRRRRAVGPRPARAVDRARPDRAGCRRADRDPRRRTAAGGGDEHGRGRARHRRRRRRARDRVLARHPRHRHARARRTPVLDVRRVLAAAARERLLVSQIQEVT